MTDPTVTKAQSQLGIAWDQQVPPEEVVHETFPEVAVVSEQGVSDLSPAVAESDTDYDEDQFVLNAQELIDSGMAWQLEGHVGRQCMALIEDGQCTLGPVGYRDYWGNYVPSKTEVAPGTKGSQEYVDERKGSN